MKTLQVVLLLALLALLGSCTPPQIVSSTPEYVVIGDVYAKDSPRAWELAEEYCRYYQRRAVLAPGEPPEGKLIFFCEGEY